MGNDRNGKKSSQSVLQEVLGGLQAAPLSAAARTKTNGAARLSSQAEKHHVRVVALARLFPPPTRRNRPESSQEPHTAVSQRRRLLWARSRRAAAVFTAASYTATVAASVRPEGGRTQDLTFDLPVSSQMPLSRSSFPPSAVTSCSRVKRQDFVSPPDPPALTLSLAHSLPLPLSPSWHQSPFDTVTRVYLCLPKPHSAENKRRTMQRDGFARRFIVPRIHGGLMGDFRQAGRSELRRDAAAAGSGRGRDQRSLAASR